MAAPAVWLSEPEPTVGFRGLAAVAGEAGHRVCLLADAKPLPGAIVVSDPTWDTGLPCRLSHRHHLALTHRRDEPFVRATSGPNATSSSRNTLVWRPPSPVVTPAAA